MTEAATPFQEGFRACRAGATIHENPYAPFTSEHSGWQAGWEDMAEHQHHMADAVGFLYSRA